MLATLHARKGEEDLMLPVLIAMGAVLFATIGYALMSPDPVASEGTDEDANT